MNYFYIGVVSQSDRGRYMLKENYGPSRTSTVDRSLPFAGENEVLGTISGQSCVFCFFTPIMCAFPFV